MSIEYYAVMHKEKGGCGKAAFTIDFKPEVHDPLFYTSVIYDDGREVKPGDSIICQACNKQILVMAAAHVLPL